MNEEERERTMNFILEQQAQSAARMEKFEEGMQRLEEADSRAIRRLDKLERTLVRMAVQFRRERKDLRDRINALVDSQIRSEDKIAYSGERLSRMEEMLERGIASSRENFRGAEKRMQRVEEMLERNAVASEARFARLDELTARNSDAIERNSEAIRHNSEDIRALTRFVSRDGGKQNGGADEG